MNIAGLRLPDMATTVVGSFPASPPPASLLEYCRTGLDPYPESMKEAVEAQMSAGVDIISDGQTRNDMVRLFTTKLGGIRMRGKPVVIGEIVFRAPITLGDQVLAREFIRDRALLKGIITGPFTLAMSSQDEHYGSTEKLAMAYAEALNREARALAGVVDMLQVDEPFFSVEYPEYASALVETIFAGVGVPKALHACGDVGGIFSEMVELPVDILDHEFAAHPDLLDAVADVDFDQAVGFGCVRSDLGVVETVGEISERIKKGLGCIDARKMLLDPDCGLRHLEPAAARAKLASMVKARSVVMDEGGDH